MQKGFTYVTFVIAILLTVVGVALVSTIIFPAIERARISGVINDAWQQLRVIDSLIQQVASEGIGSQRQYNLRVTLGSFSVNNKTGSFDFTLSTQYSPIPPGTESKKGNILLSTSTAGARAYEDDVDNDGEKELVLENEVLKIGFEKYPKDYKIVGIGGEGYEYDSSGNSLDNGLVLYLPFEEGHGTVTKDASGYGNDGNLVNGPAWVDGKFGKALSFDGVDDYVDGISPLPIVNSYSVVVWFKRQGNPRGTGDNNYHTLIQSISGYGVYPRLLVYASGGSVLLQQTNSTGNEVNLFAYNQPFGDNQFHQIIGTFDGSTMKLFIDGKFNASISCNGLQTGTTKFRIGAHSSVGTYQANGLIDEVRIYNRALSDEEIKQLYEQSRIKFQNDFIQIKATKTFLNITNSTNTLYSLFIPSIRLDGNPIYYYFSTNETKIYFFDWYSNSWKIWVQGVNNATHGSPDFSLPKFKQEFKLLYSFDSSKTDAKINLTFILTNHDPFLRTIIDVNSVKYHRLEIPVETQNQQKACLIADYQNGKLASWNQRNCAERGNSYSSYSPVWNLKFPFNDTGLVGYWKFDEGSGTIAKDSSGYNNDGTLVNGPTWVDGKFGKALKFDGVDDYVNVGHSESVNIVNAITIAAWVMFLRDPALDRYSGILGKTYTDYKGYNLQTGPYTGKLLFTFGTGSAWINVQSNTVFTTGRFYHVVGTFDGTVAKFYTNGVLDCSPVAYSGTIAEDPTKDLLIGQVPDGTTKYVNAIIDEVRIYNRALSEEEIKQLYEQQVIFYSENYENKGNEWNLSSQVNKTTDLLNTTFYLDNDLYKTNTQQIELPIPDSSSAKVYYQAQDGSYRDIKELASIGQGLWSYEVTRDDSLVLWQSFDEGFGNIAHDFSDYGNDGVIYGANWTDGKFGKALSFDGIDDYLQAPFDMSKLIANKAFTVEAWVYWRAYSSWAKAISTDYREDGSWSSPWVFFTLSQYSTAGTWEIFAITARKTDGSIFSSNANTGVPVELNKWLHVVGRTWIDGTTMYAELWINGALKHSYSVTNVSNYDYGNSKNIFLAVRSAFSKGEWGNLLLDEVRIYNRALSEDEIKSHYLFGLPKHGIKNKLLLTSTLAGSDGFDYGIRDSYPGGSYWLDEKGNSLDSGLVGYWKFSEGSGTTTADSSGYGNTGTIYGANWTDGKFGKALQFDGVDDYVDLGVKDILRPPQFTLEAWFLVKNFDKKYLVLLSTINDANTQGYELVVNNDSARGADFDKTLGGVVGTGSGLTLLSSYPTRLSLNTWYHAILTYNGSTAQLYLNGVLVASTTTTYTASTRPTRIGVDARTTLTWYFNGTIDEVRIYNRALSDDEIKALYQAGRIRLSNDFLTVQSHPSIQTNLTNSTNSNLFNLIAEEIKVDNQPLTNIYPANPINNSINVYFFDWKDNTWKIWMKGANNLTHGVPDWLDPRFKQEFKWRYEFKRDLYPSINLTFLMTSHDPYIRIFVDSSDPDTIVTNGDNVNDFIYVNTTSNYTVSSSSGSIDISIGLDGTVATAKVSAISDIANRYVNKGVYYRISEDSNSKATLIVNYTDGTQTTLTLDSNSWNEGVLSADKTKVVDKIIVDCENNTANTGVYTHCLIDYIVLRSEHNITLPFVPTQSEKRLGMKADSNNLKLWNQQNSKSYGNPWKEYTADGSAPDGEVALVAINSGTSSYLCTATSYVCAAVLHGMRGTLNWALDKTNNKYSFEFYLDNDLQKVSPTTIWDTVVTSDWSITSGTGTLYNDTADYKSGTESLNASVTSDADGFIALTYNPAGTWDFSTKEFLALWLKLNSTSEYFTINVTDSLGNWTLWNRSTPANTLQDLNNTWRRWVIPLRKYELNGSGGPADLTSIDSIEIKVKVNPSTDYWIKVDDIVIDVSQLVKVETFVPDSLLDSASGFRIYSWDGSTYQPMFFYNPTAYKPGQYTVGDVYYLDGTKGTDIWPYSYDAYGGWVAKKRDETTNECYWCEGGSITYSSYYGVQKRIGFYIKMPPDDGQDNSTYGISQAKLKLEVYYDDEGKATYEFSNDNNQYYGLQNQLAPYYFLYNYQTNDLPLFITSNKRGAYSSYGSFLQVRADENEVYDKIQFSYDFNSTINQNLMFTLGYLGLTDTYTSSSGDTNVPDIFEGYKTWQFGNESFESVANSTLTYYDLKDDSLVGYWDFDEGSGTIAGDRSGNGNTGTLVNGPTWVDGKFGKALSFDGVNDYVDCGNNPSLNITDAITVEAWIKIKAWTGTYQMFVGRSFYYWEIGAQNKASFRFYLKTGGTAHEIGSYTYPALDTWYHVVLTYDSASGIFKSYINGATDRTLTFSGKIDASPYNLWIGRDPYYNGYYPSNSIIDEVRIYNRALSEEEIKAHYYSGLESHQYGKFENSDKNVTHTLSYSFKYNSTYIDDFNVGIKRYVGVEDSSTNLQPITPKDTVLHLRFNEGSGNITKDISGFGNDGILNPNVSWTKSCITNFGSCVIFNNSAAEVTVPDHVTLNISSPFTIAHWIKAETIQTAPNPIYTIVKASYNGTHDLGYALGLAFGTNKPRFVIFTSGSSIIGPTPINDSKWHHIAGSFNGTHQNLYVDGILVANAPSGNPLLAASPLRIGRLYDNSYFNGTIDEVLIINRSLSEEEIKQLYLGGYYRRIGNNTHRVASYDDLNYIAFNLTDKDDSSQTQYDQRKLRIEVDYSRNPEGLASFIFSNSTNNWHGLQSMNLPYIALINSNSQDKAQFITTSHKTQSFEPLRIASSENGIIRKVSSDYDFNGSKRFSFSLGYSGLVNTASDSDNNKIPDYLEDKTKGIEWSNESISSIASSTLTYYDIKNDPYKIVPEWKTIEGDFVGDLKTIGIQDVKIGNVWYHPLGVENAINYATRTINSTLSYKMFYPRSWLSEWAYRKPITINNTQNTNTLTDYQVLVTLDTASLITAGKMRSDCGDIRFTDSDATSLLNYWIESGCNTTNTKIWVKVPSIPTNSTKTIYVYYGNPSATSLSNGDNTFLFFDDFNTDTIGTKWQRNNNGLYDTSDSYCYIDTANSRAVIDSIAWESLVTKTFSIARPVIIETKFLQTTSFAGEGYTGGIQYYDPATSLDFNRYSYHTFANGTYAKIRYGGTSSSTDYTGDAISLSVGTWYINQMILTVDTVYGKFYNADRTYRGGVSLANANWNNKKIGLDNFVDGTAGKPCYFDWILVRKYTSPEPTTSVGNEEAKPLSLELRFSLNGSVVSTNDLIKSIKYKGQTEILPVDSSIRINQNESSTYGFGKTYLVTRGEGLDRAQLIAEVNSLNGSYSLTYTLPSQADYFTISTDYPGEIENSYAFKIGDSVSNDVLQISGSSLAQGCYNSTQISSYYACSYDSGLDISTGLIYKGLKSNFKNLCYSNYTHYDLSQNYKLRISSINKEEVIVPIVKGNCNLISNKYYLIASDQLPKNFGEIKATTGLTAIHLSLSYPNIKLVGTETFPRGDYTICLKKSEEDLAYKLTYVSLQTC